MGKTESGAIWLDKDLLSSFDYWQFWRNTDDRDVIKFLKMFTDIPTEKIENIKDQNINELKILLAMKQLKCYMEKMKPKNLKNWQNQL